MMKKNLCLLLLLSGCTVGPDYKNPDVQLPPDWTQKAPSTLVASPQKDILWWQNFHDSLLNKLIQTGIEANLDIALSLEKIKESRAYAAGATTHLTPTIKNIDSYTRNHFSQNAQNVSASTSGNNNTSSNLFKVGFDASWEIDIFGGLRRAQEAQEAHLEAVIADSHAVFITTVAEIAKNYIIYRKNQQQEKILIAIVDTLKAQLALQADLTIAGINSQIDVMTAETALMQTAAKIPPIQANKQIALHQLSILLGKTPDYLSAQLEPIGDVPTADTVILSALPSTLLQQRPDICQAERDLARTTASVGVSIAQLFPIFQLTGLFAWQSFATHNLLSKQSQYFSGGPSVTLPLIDFGKIKSQIKAQESLQKQAFIRYKQTILNALEDVENGLVNFNQEDQQYQKLQQAMQYNFKNYQLYQVRFQSGLDTMITSYNAKITYLLSQQDVLNSQAQRSLNLVNLYKSLGGGWG